MPRKRKGQDRDDCPKDLNEILYIQSMNGRHPTGLSALVALDPQGSSAQMPRAAYELEEEESDSEYRGDAVGTDDDDDDEDYLGMSEDEEGDNEDDDDVAEEETQPVTPPPKRNASKTTSAVKRKGKAPVEEPRPEPRKKRATAPREKSMWSDRESTIFVAARWFTKDEFHQGEAGHAIMGAPSRAYQGGEPGLDLGDQRVAEAVAQPDAPLEGIQAGRWREWKCLGRKTTVVAIHGALQQGHRCSRPACGRRQGRKKRQRACRHGGADLLFARDINADIYR
ncbi:unnamed protein product [Closterium sp. NIES-54]